MFSIYDVYLVHTIKKVHEVQEEHVKLQCTTCGNYMHNIHYITKKKQ